MPSGTNRICLALFTLVTAAGTGCNGAGATVNDARVDAPDAAVADVPMPTDDGHDVPDADDAQGLPDAGDGDASACPEGQVRCDGDWTALCRDGTPVRVADCAADGWMCREGRCVATGAETPTEAAWRARLDDLRTANTSDPLAIDDRGGWTGAPEVLGNPEATGFFRVEKLGDTWWFVTPEGRPFLSKGVTDVNFLGPNLAMDDLQAALAAKYGSEAAWADAAEDRLDDWGFNTIGPWSGASIAARRPSSEDILDVVWRVRPEGHPIGDFLRPDYPDIVRQLAAERCAPRRDDPSFLGYFLDNELVWENSWQTKKPLLRLYWEFPADQPGRAAAAAFLRGKAGDSLATFNAAWGTALGSWDDLAGMPADALEPETSEARAWSEAFTLHVFERYASEAVQAIREADPNHLVLGCRFSTWHSDALIAAAAKHFDVVSLAYYWEEPPVAQLDRLAPTLDRPFLIEEWSFKAEDSGLMNVLYFAPVVPTQKDRGLEYDAYVEALVRRPWVVAYHWYKWFDNPPREDNLLAGDNFGLIDKDDVPYAPFVRMVREVNRRAERWHAEGIGP